MHGWIGSIVFRWSVRDSRYIKYLTTQCFADRSLVPAPRAACAARATARIDGAAFIAAACRMSIVSDVSNWRVAGETGKGQPTAVPSGIRNPGTACRQKGD